jgi:hypothetical protein
MSDKQIGMLYGVVFLMAVIVGVTLEALLAKPTSAEEYAHALCQELYGAQTGATWEKGTLMCESARGEFIEVKKVR